MQYVFINNKPNNITNFLIVEVVDYDWRMWKIMYIIYSLLSQQIAVLLVYKINKIIMVIRR